MRNSDIEVKVNKVNADTGTGAPKLSGTPPQEVVLNVDALSAHASLAAARPLPPPALDAEAFLTTGELSRRLRCSVGTITNWRKKGLLPWIASPGRLVLFSWPDVREAMRRRQRGGQQ
jgi:excisionase family DNA binding protein